MTDPLEGVTDAHLQAALDAICNCAASVTLLSYQEAIEGYLKLRGTEL
jgi:hypothetical protein